MARNKVKQFLIWVVVIIVAAVGLWIARVYWHYPTRNPEDILGISSLYTAPPTTSELVSYLSLRPPWALWAAKELIKRGDEPGVVDALIYAENDPDAQTQCLATFVLYRLGHDPEERMIKVIHGIETGEVGFAAKYIALLLEPSDSRYIEHFVKMLDSGDIGQEWFAAQSLGVFLQDPEIEALLIAQLISKPELKETILLSLERGYTRYRVKSPNPELRGALIELLRDENRVVVFHVLDILKKHYRGDRVVIEGLLSIVETPLKVIDPNQWLKERCLETLGDIAPLDVVMRTALPIIKGDSPSAVKASAKIAIWRGLQRPLITIILFLAIVFSLAIIILRSRKLAPKGAFSKK